MHSGDSIFHLEKLKVWISRTPTSFGLRSTLPPEMVEQARRRLGWAGLGFAMMWAMYLPLPGRLLGRPPEIIEVVVALGAIAAGLGMFALCRSSLCPSRTVLTWGLVFQVAGSLDISLLATWGKYSPEYVTPFGSVALQFLEHWGLLNPYPRFAVQDVSWVSVWIVSFPLFVPYSPWKSFLASLLSALMMPLSLLVSFAINGISPFYAPQVNILVFASVFPPVLCALMAFFATKILYRLGAAVTRARDMGSYTLIEPLGKGGMGEVWKARHHMLARPAAIKLIRSEALLAWEMTGPEGPRMSQRFEREAQATASLASPHVVQLYDFGTAADGSFYYVMELLEGVNLQVLVEEYGAQPPERVVHFLQQACHALAEAHDQELIHRDIKPANLTTCRLGREYDFLKILDFGLVKPFGELESNSARLTQIGSITGTPGFMAPEVAQSEEEIDGRSDLYSLGCVAYWLLTGTMVFPGKRPLEILLHHTQTVPESPSSRLGIPLPTDVEEIVLQCLAKKPEDRFAHADALSQALETCSLAGAWTQEKARAWWRDFKPAEKRPLQKTPALTQELEVAATRTLQFQPPTWQG